jgi:uncharacterized membrane protein
MARDNDRGRRLDVPVEPRRGLTVPSVDPETAGKASESIARFLGSWRFIGYMTAFILLWLGWNAFGPESLRWDEYPFILLTLVLSLQASYAAPLILLAQNRQADRDRVQYQSDRDRGERLVADSEYLARELAGLRAGIGEVATRDFVRGEIRDLLDELDEERSVATRKAKKDRTRRVAAEHALADLSRRAADRSAEERGGGESGGGAKATT